MKKGGKERKAAGEKEKYSLKGDRIMNCQAQEI